MKTYQTYLFDWDGCLAQTLKIWLNAYKKIFAEYNLFPTDREITSKVFGSWRGPINTGLLEKDLKNFGKKMIAEVNLKLPNVELYPHVLIMLKRLKAANKHTAILTTSLKSNILPPLKNTQVEPLIDFLITADDVSHQKPHPESILKILSKLNADKHTSVIIGDTTKDIETGRNAGIDSILYYPKENKKFYDLASLKKSKPTFVISNFLELTANNLE